MSTTVEAKIQFYAQIQATASTLMELHARMDSFADAFAELNRTRIETREHIKTLTANLEQMMSSANGKEYQLWSELSLKPEVEPRGLKSEAAGLQIIASDDRRSYIRKDAACEMMGLSMHAFEKLYKSGRLQVHKKQIGNKYPYLFLRRDIENLIELERAAS
ncbi:MAG: hypothetical protein Tp1111DCM511881_14 [Prokaryotic dsDNA virus sp.]|nr:MAG: hypothetical protein Tp1111DCM511881_14 [Prokaryotic dsDNA virus sp.]|tara:strand:+ start:43 stop:528 length:486 start_codon:yes stop_codon:yes gene_type:complete